MNPSQADTSVDGTLPCSGGVHRETVCGYKRIGTTDFCTQSEYCGHKSLKQEAFQLESFLQISMNSEWLLYSHADCEAVSATARARVCVCVGVGVLGGTHVRQQGFFQQRGVV